MYQGMARTPACKNWQAIPKEQAASGLGPEPRASLGRTLPLRPNHILTLCDCGAQGQDPYRTLYTAKTIMRGRFVSPGITYQPTLKCGHSLLKLVTAIKVPKFDPFE